MELAGQWRREWAGAAEYGKVTEGGVTRRIARAMEVLHASSADTRVRVMRAVYHSSSGPGVPAASFMLHSSRRVIPSGSRLLDSPTTSKPFEISSAPYESSPEPETPNYHVTEPDDTEISEPSKWRGSNSSKSIRLPSEESSSTDNASIIDLDTRAHHNSIFRKCSLDSENSDIITNKRTSFRASPILESPTTLSTLKFKSLLSNNNDWIDRRKSYSFEDTAPLNETIVHSNDTLAMESSTDSGICKSTELVNETDDVINNKNINIKNTSPHKSEDSSFKNWLNKNRKSFDYSVKQNPSQVFSDQVIVKNNRNENNIAVKSTGKVSIALPVLHKIDDDINHKKYHLSEERKSKRVEFCKTELHFAADTGKVNIIATDEKPPPSNDFRKRRSAFVPIRERFEKPITLFGEKVNDFPEFSNIGNQTNTSLETHAIDEHSATTKSILKNKIPKPKPYLLGENMEFGKSEEHQVIETDKKVSSAVSIINNQLNEKTTQNTSIFRQNEVIQPEEGYNSSPNRFYEDCQKGKTYNIEIQREQQDTEKVISSDSVRKKLNDFKMSPIQERIRKLKESDLTYFGINNEKRREPTPKYFKDRIASQNEAIDDIFHSVRLVQRISSSVGNSEAESEDDPEYQNVPLKSNYTPVPTPRGRHKSDVLKPIIEQDSTLELEHETRRSRSRKQEEYLSSINRSISEPPKVNRRSIKNEAKTEKLQKLHEKSPTLRTPKKRDETATYINILKEKDIKLNSHDRKKLELQIKPNSIATQKENQSNVEHDLSHTQHSKPRKHRTKVLSTPDDPSDKLKTTLSKISQRNSVKEKDMDTLNSANKYRSKSYQRNKTDTIRDERNNDQKGSHKSKNSNYAANDCNVDTSTDSCSKKRSLKVDKYHNQSSRHQPNLEHNGIEKYPETTKQIPRENDRKISRDNNGTVYKSTKPSKYVINYDDKDGTVSSICKIKTGTNVSSKKKVKDILPEKHHKKSQKVLQLPEQQTDSDGLTYAYNTRKRKMYGQRTCQLL